jgi:hypothetical protein
MAKKDPGPFLFIGVTALGVSILAVTVDHIVVAAVAALFTIGGLRGAALQQWSGRKWVQRKFPKFELADIFLLGLILLWVLVAAAWIIRLW